MNDVTRVVNKAGLKAVEECIDEASEKTVKTALSVCYRKFFFIKIISALFKVNFQKAHLHSALNAKKGSGKFEIMTTNDDISSFHSQRVIWGKLDSYFYIGLFFCKFLSTNCKGKEGIYHL